MLANDQISYLPYDDYAPSTNTLFHFMTKPKYLESILRRRAIIPQYCIETILLSNALVKEIQKNDDGTMKVFYDGIDSNPMYVSFSAFETSEEVGQEIDAIMQHKKIYVNALTSNEYIDRYQEEKRSEN